MFTLFPEEKLVELIFVCCSGQGYLNVCQHERSLGSLVISGRHSGEVSEVR